MDSKKNTSWSKFNQILLILSISTFSSCSFPLMFKDKVTSIKIAAKPKYHVASWVIMPPDKQQFDEMVRKLQKAFSKYPIDFLKKYIEEVKVYERYSWHGMDYAGTYHSNKIIVSLRDGLWYVENTFHHEFNHLLYDAKAKELFDEVKWRECNIIDFDYKSGWASYRFVKEHGTSQPWFDTLYLEQGFTSAYSMNKIMEDVARYAEALFLSEQRFWDAFDNYERVRAKARLLIDFYYKLDPIFTEEYFRELENQQGVELE